MVSPLTPLLPPTSPDRSAEGQKTYRFVTTPQRVNHMVGPVSPKTQALSNVIYEIYNERNGKRYFGSVSISSLGNNVSSRLQGYKRELKEGRVRHELHQKNRYVINAVLKAIRERSDIEVSEVRMTWRIVAILPPETTEKEMHSIEGRFQDRYHTRDRLYGYNTSDPREEPLRVGRKPKRKDRDYSYNSSSSSSSSSSRGKSRRVLADITNEDIEVSRLQQSHQKQCSSEVESPELSPPKLD